MKKIILLIVMLLMPFSRAFADAAEEIPKQIAAFISAARAEVAEADNKPLPKNNRYSVWYFGDQRKIGWCACFVSWCANEAGMTLIKKNDAEPMPDDAVFASNEASVPKTYLVYEGAERLTDIPRPGYQVMYGVIGGTPYTHVGLVESVKDLGDGVYELTTLEGNVGNTCRRYCYRYSLNPKQKHRNQTAVPAQEQDRDDAQYKIHNDGKWYIIGFGQTWK